MVKQDSGMEGCTATRRGSLVAGEGPNTSRRRMLRIETLRVDRAALEMMLLRRYCLDVGDCDAQCEMLHDDEVMLSLQRQWRFRVHGYGRSLAVILNWAARSTSPSFVVQRLVLVAYG